MGLVRDAKLSQNSLTHNEIDNIKKIVGYI